MRGGVTVRSISPTDGWRCSPPVSRTGLRSVVLIVAPPPLSASLPRVSVPWWRAHRSTTARIDQKCARLRIVIGNGLDLGRIPVDGCSPAMAKTRVLYPSADLIQDPVGDTHPMKRVRDAHRVLQAPLKACPIGVGQIGRNHVDRRSPAGLPIQPDSHLGTKPRTVHFRRPIRCLLTSVSSKRGSGSTSVARGSLAGSPARRGGIGEVRRGSPMVGDASEACGYPWVTSEPGPSRDARKGDHR